MALIGFLEIFLAGICFAVLRLLGKRGDGLPRNWPLVGMLPELLLNLSRVHDWATGILERSRCNFLLRLLWFSGMDMLFTADPANVHYIMSTNFGNFPKGPEFKRVFDVLGDGIFNSDSDRWRMQRRVAQALMNDQRFHRFLATTTSDKVENGLLKVFDELSRRGVTVDLQDLFQRFTFDSACKFVTGFDPGSLSVEFPEVPFSKALDDAEEVIFYRHLYPEWFGTLQRLLGIGVEEKLRRAWEDMDQIVGNYIVLKRVELREGTREAKGDENGADLLTSYMVENETLGALECNDKFLRDTILNFMVAGKDTTSSALTWFFWALSMNPSVEMRIVEEIRSVIPKEEENLSVFKIGEHMDKMVYLHGALCESLRLYPPVPFQHKCPVKADVLPSGHTVDPGTKILFHLYSMGRMKSVWGEDCLEFRPERWISERGGIRHEPSYKFLAFNAGPRTCLGKEMAFTQMKTVTAAVIINYEVHVVEGHPVRPSNSIILHMKHGLRAKLTRRRL
ncbi:alkane hydroxylase MAH1-like [Rhodamnia argentea]|uniref:Alkane hydroxylase MAH1-like n=1 Tax=Rhodamnia argentea TaxID=178133 RepID=A0A8B8P0M6_9MYRT|nr:alkane hydroxylase MAH1-like [Rhodamnia argentea]